MGYNLRKFRKQNTEGEKNISSSSSYSLRNARDYSTIAEDEAKTRSTLANIYGGWQDAQTMADSRASVQNMYNTLNRYKSFKQTNDFDDVIGAYKNALDNWDSITEYYGKFKNADAYNAEAKKAQYYKDNPNLSYLDVRAKMSQTDENSDEYGYLKEYGMNAGFNSASDYDAMLGYLKDNGEKDLYDKTNAKKNQYELSNGFNEYKKYMQNSDFDVESQKEAPKTAFGRKNVTDLATIKNMTDEERAVGNYIYNTRGEDAYWNYMDDMAMSVGYRDFNADTENLQEWLQGHPGRETLYTIGSYLTNAASYIPVAVEQGRAFFTDEEYNPYMGASGIQNRLQSGRSAISADIASATDFELPIIGNVGAAIYDVTNSTIDSALGAFLYGHGFAPLMGTSAFNSTYKEAIENGLNPDNAVMTSVLSGLAETTFEYVSLEHLLKIKDAKNVKQFFINLIGQSIAEGSEEVNTEIANKLSDIWVNGNASDYARRADELRSYGYSDSEIKKTINREFALDIAKAGLEGMASGALMGGVQTALQTEMAREQGVNVDYEALKKTINDADFGEELKSLEEKYPNRNGLNYYTELGTIYSKALEKTGQTLNEKETNEERSKAFKDYINLLKAQKSDAQIKAEKQTRKYTAEKTSYNGKEVALLGMTEDGKVKTSEGDADIKDLDLSSKDATVVVMASDMSDKMKADAFVANYKGQNLTEYEVNFNLAFVDGRMEGKEGITVNQMLEDIDTSVIGPMEATKIFESGKASVNVASAKIDTVGEEIINKYRNVAKKGKFDVTAIKGMELTSTEKAILRIAEAFSVMGVNVRVIKDIKASSINGEFDRNNNEVVINLAARYSANGDIFDRRYVLPTMAHEFTHWMEKKAAPEFKQLQDLIFGFYGEKKTELLIAQEQKRYEEKHEGKLSRADAISEVMARACEDMLSDGKVLEDILSRASRSTLESLKAKVMEFFENMKAFLKDLMDGYASFSEAARYLRANQKVFEQAQKLWANAFDKALENNRIESVNEQGTKQNSKIVEEVFLSNNDMNANLHKVHSMDAVAKIEFTNIDVSNDKKETIKKFSNHFIEKGFEYVTNDVIGQVDIAHQGIPDIFRHGGKEYKASFIDSVPYVLKMGKAVYADVDHKGKGYNTIVFVAPITFYGKGYKNIQPGTYFVAVSVQREQKPNGKLQSVHVTDLLVTKKETSALVSFQMEREADNKFPSLNDILNHVANDVNMLPESDKKVFYSDKVSSDVNESMTMDECADMIQRAFVLAGGIKSYPEYKNGIEWLKGEGIEEVVLTAENEYTLQEKFFNKIPNLYEDFDVEDILRAYLDGTLVGKQKAKTQRIDVSKPGLKDNRFYAPKNIENYKEYYELAQQKMTGENKAKVIEARAKVLMFAHNKGAAELLGITTAELNKKLRSWTNESASVREIYQRLNANTSVENQWSGIANMTWLNRATVSETELDNLIRGIEGDSNNNQRAYIVRTMLALDTHIDYKELLFKFKSVPDANSKSTNGFYTNKDRSITVKYDAPNTVAHEMGHYLDYKWGRDMGYQIPLTEACRRNMQKISGTEQWIENFSIFLSSIESSSDIRSEYTMDSKEVFARFVARFVEWTDNLANNRNFQERDFYNDKFTQAQFIEFARLLQEKSAIDGNADVLFNDKSENEGKLPPYAKRGKYASTLSKAEYDIISEDIRNDIRQRKRDGYSLDYSGYIILNKHTVFYESYDDVNPEIVETITTKRIIDYGKRDIWISNYFNSFVGRKEFFGPGNRKRVREFANRIGVHGFDRIMHSEYDGERRIVQYSDKVTDSDLLDFLNGQIERGEYVTTYKSMRLDDGQLHSPMAALINGKYENEYELGSWYQAVEHPELVKIDKKNGQPYFNLQKGKDEEGKDLGTVPARYNPYEHSSNYVINDQFKTAYKRDNLVTVEMRIPMSELTSGYKAQYAKDAVGWQEWKKGDVATALAKKGMERKVLLSRYAMPYRIVPNSEVATKYKELLEGTDIKVPNNVVTPSLLSELEKVGVPIDENGISKFEGLYSDKVDSDVADLLGKTKQIEAENKRLKADVERLNKVLKLNRTVTKGMVLKDSQLDVVARVLLKDANSKMDKAELISGLKEVYGYILENSSTEGKEVNWDVLMGKAFDLARKLMAESRPEVIEDVYYKGILRDIRQSRVRLDEQQIAEAKNWYGERYRDAFMGKVILVKDGISLDSQWQEWATMYPDIFDADMNSADMPGALLDVYDDVKEMSETLQYYNDYESVKAMAVEIYEKFWNVDTVNTMADKHKAEILKLKADHRQAMTELKAKADEQTLADKMYYNKLLKKLRDKNEAEKAELKEYMKKKNAERKDAILRKAQIEKITDTALTLGKWLTANSVKEHIPTTLQGPVKALISAIDFSSKQLLGMRGGENAFTPTKKDISISKALEKVRDVVTNAEKAQTDSGVAEGLDTYIDFPPQYAEDINKISQAVNEIERRIHKDNAYILNEMSLEDLKSLAEAVTVMKHCVTGLNKLISTTNAHSVDYFAQGTIQEASEHAQRKKEVGKVLKYGQRFLDFIDFQNGVPYYVTKRLGPSAHKMFKLLVEGQNKFAFNIKEVVDFADGCYTTEEATTWLNEVHEFDILEVASDAEKAEGQENRERHITMTTAQIMSLYCLNKREQARGHIFGGGIVINGYDTKFKHVAAQKGVTLTDSELEKILKVVTENPRVKEVADNLQLFMNTVCQTWGNEISMKRFGIEAFTEENYFPIASDSNVTNAEPRDSMKSIYALLNMSFTKSLVKNANNRIVIDDIFNTFTIHAGDMAKYNAIALPVLDYVKWFNYKEKVERGDAFETITVKGALDDAFGAEASKYIRHLLYDLNGQAEMGRGEGIIKKFTKGYKIAAVGANLQVALLQPTSYLRATYVMDEKYLLKALTRKPSIAKCKEHCGLALWKSFGFYNTDVSRGLDALIKHSDKWKDKLVEKSNFLAEKADEITWGTLWNACEAEIMEKNPSLAYNSEEFNKAVADRLTDVILATQVVDSTLTRSDLMRGTSMAVQAVTAFQAEPTLSLNMLNDARTEFTDELAKTNNLSKALQKSGKKIAKATEAYLLTSVLESCLRAGMSKLRNPSDDEDDEYIKLVIQNFKDELNVLNKIPIIKDVIESWNGYSSTRMDMAAIESTVGIVKEFQKIILDGKEWSYKTTYKLITAISQASGLPLSNVLREIAMVWNNTIGLMYPDIRLLK